MQRCVAFISPRRTLALHVTTGAGMPRPLYFPEVPGPPSCTSTRRRCHVRAGTRVASSDVLTQNEHNSTGPRHALSLDASGRFLKGQPQSFVRLHSTLLPQIADKNAGAWRLVAALQYVGQRSAPVPPTFRAFQLRKTIPL
ncbi:hypothetical protein IF2G_10997 [Cordyceps javanica]|nr:hypothetical protein IF2G_10997 [Cordyceps javanica]